MDYRRIAQASFSDVVKVLSSVDLGEAGLEHTTINSLTDWLDCTSFMTMQGNRVFYFFAISANYELLKTMYKNMFSEHLESVNSDAGDLLGEICNQTAGKIKTQLSPDGHTFDMCSPVVVFGNNVRVRNLADLPGGLFSYHLQGGSKARLFVHSKEL